MKILTELLFFTVVYYYLKKEGTIAIALIWLTMRQVKIDSPIWNFILFLIALAITIFYLGIFFELPIQQK
jgi:hypothetical protein